MAIVEIEKQNGLPYWLGTMLQEFGPVTSEKPNLKKSTEDSNLGVAHTE